MKYLKINHHQLEFLDRNYAVILTFLQLDFGYFLTFSNQGNERLQRSEIKEDKRTNVCITKYSFLCTHVAHE